MTRNLRHDLKRVAAGVCALMLVSGTVPVKPIADVINEHLAIVASAEDNTDFDFTFNEVTEAITADDVNSLQAASTEKVRSWICKNAAAISQANPEYDNEYYFAYIDTVDENNVICIFAISASDMQDSEALENNLIYGSDAEPGMCPINEEYVNELVGDVNNSIGIAKIYLCAPSAAQNTSTEQGTGFTQLNSVDELNADLPEISPDDAKAWVLEHMDEIKALDPDYKNYYDFVFKYNGGYYSVCVGYQSFNTDDLEGYWGAYDLYPDSLEECKNLVSFWKRQNQLIFLWRGAETSLPELTLTPAESLTFTGDALNLVKGDIPEGTKFSLTEPSYVVDYDSEKDLISPWMTELTKKENAAMADERDSEYYYYAAAAHALNNYSEAIDFLKNGNESEASDAIDSAKEDADEMPGCGYTPSSDDLDAVNYIQEHIVGEDFEAFKARFGPDTTDWQDTAEATDAGDYTVWYKGDGVNYSEDVKSFEVTIGKAPVTVTPAENLTFTGEPLNLVKGNVPAGTKFSFEAPIVFDVEAEWDKISGLQETLHDCEENASISEESEKAAFYSSAYSALKCYRNAIYDFANSGNAPTDSINYANEAISDMDDLADAYVIVPADEVEEALEYINTYVRGLTAEKIEERCKTVEPNWLDTAEATNAGDYVVYYKGDGVNYSDDIKSFYVSIEKADPIVTAPIAKTGLLYTGEAQELVEGGTTTGGTLQYGVQVTPNVYTADSATVKINPALLKDGDVLMVTRNSESIIEFTGGTVKYRNSQGDLVPESIVSINYGYWSSIPPYHYINLNHPEGSGEMLNNVDYNALLVTGKDGDTITLEPYNYTEGDKTIAWSSKVASGTDVGTYEVFYRVIGNDNYNGANAESIENITISKGTPTVTAPTAKTDLVYNGKDQALIEKGSTTGGTIEYSLDGEEFSTEIPEGKTAGNYTVYYKVIGDDNYNSTDVKTVDVTIARADLPVTVTGYEGTYDGKSHGITVDVGNSDAVVYYAKTALNADNYADIGSTENQSFTNAGTYRVYYYVTTGNYDPNPVSGFKLVNIKKADAPALTDDQKPTPVEDLIYTGEDQDLVVAPESIPNGYSIRYSINGGAWISTLPTAIESGTYTVAYKYVENTNYKDIAGETFTITVKDKYTEPMWVWADDYSSATATFIKNDNSSEPIILDAEVTSEVVSEPTYTEYGKTVYFATVELEGKTYTYRKPVITAMLSLTHVEAVPASCTEAGNIEYWFDAENEKYFADDKGENEITEADTIVAPIDHAYGEPQWIWNAENAATATFKCANCGDEQVVNAVVTAEVTAPTYTKNGKTVYTATVNFDGKTYTDTLTVTIGKKAYTAPAISYLKGDGAVKLSWNAIEGAERYAIAGFIDGKWKLLNRTEDTSYILENLEAGKEYKVAVVAMFDGEYIMDFSNAITVTPKPAAASVYPKITEIEYNEQYHQFKLNWTEVPNAQNYGIAVYLAGKWKIQTQSIPATQTSYTSPKLKAGSTYKMIVCAKVNGKWDLSALSSRAFEVTVK